MMVERILADYNRADSISSIALRYFNAAGADADGQLGEHRDPETHLIPRAMMFLQGHLDDFSIWGGDYDPPDGTPIRDYVHVSDLAEAHVDALDALLTGRPSGRFNLKTGQGYSVREVLEAISAETGRSLDVSVGAKREGDPAILIADASRACTELGVELSRSDLATIIKTAWKWHQIAHPTRQATRLVKSGNMR
jgi:UDP-glucose 4-epimerase/UDP-arabinose 4-epimerase